MVEVKVTYETLFDLLRREKSRNEIQELDDDFYEDVENYLSEKEETLNSENASQAEVEKIKIQMKNARKIVKELHEVREKKILNLAMNKVKTGSNLINTNNLLKDEKEFFEESVKLIKSYKDKVIERVENPKKNSDSKQENTINEKAEQEESKQKEENSIVKVKISSKLPKFVGFDQEVYGPYNPEDVVSLPSKIANLLISKGRAEKV